MNLSQIVAQEWRKKDPYLLDVEGFENYCKQRLPKLLKEEEKEGKRKWNLLFSIFERPIVYDQEGRLWTDTLPKWIHGAIMLERLIQAMKGEEGKATDAEVVAHLYTASLARPLPHEFVNIYCYLCIKEMERHKPFGDKNLEGIRKNLEADRPLSNYEIDELERLKRKLWEAGMRGAERKRRERKRQQKAKNVN